MSNLPSHILAYYQDLSRAGKWPIEGNVRSAKAGSLSAGELMVLYVKVEKGCILDSRFQVHGCPYAIAVAVFCANWVVGKHVSQLSDLSAQMLIEALELPQHKYHCALVGEDLIKNLGCQIAALD